MAVTQGEEHESLWAFLVTPAKRGLLTSRGSGLVPPVRVRMPGGVLGARRGLRPAYKGGGFNVIFYPFADRLSACPPKGQGRKG